MKKHTIWLSARLANWLFALLCITGGVAILPHPVAAQEVRIGVLAFRSIEQTQQQWQPTVDYLNVHVAGGYHFTIEPLFFPELDKAVDVQRFDFLLTNPEHYATLRSRHGLAVIATLMPLAEGHPVSEFGGVIFARADNTQVNALQDIRGKVVASVAEQSFGAYLIQRWTLFKHDIQISEAAKVLFTGMPQDNVVLAVLNHQAEVGFVRTGVLESMAREGKLKLDEIKVINHQPVNKFPQRLSTELYPEWAFSSLPGVPEKLKKTVSLALLNIAPDDAAAKLGNYYGFTPPGNYAPVEAVMLRLKMNPDRAEQFDWRDVMHKYEYALLGGALVLVLGMLLVALYLVRSNRRLLHSYRERKNLDEALQQANTTLEERVERRTQQLQQSEARFRNMFEHHSSPMLLIDPHSGEIFDANTAATAFYGYPIAQMQRMNIMQINTLSREQIATEMALAQSEQRNYFVFTHRLADGAIRNVEVHSSSVEMADRQLLFSIIHDITERKQLEAQMHDLAFYDPLTKLPNRRLLLDRVSKAIDSAKRTRRHGALMFLDLDHFKTLNDLHGHDVGDLMLIEVSNRLLRCIRAEDSAARLGGDEFVVLLEGLAERLSEAVL